MINDFSIEDITNEEQNTLAKANILIAGKNTLSTSIEQYLLKYGLKNIEIFEDTEILKLDNIKNFDMFVDCTNNFKSKFLLNKTAQKHNIPLIFSLNTEYSIQYAVIIPQITPCLSCMFPDRNIEKNVYDICNEAMSTRASFLITEKIVSALLKKLKDTDNYLFNYQNSSDEVQKIKLSKNSNCPICSK